jgi:hypothetical protein
VVTVGGEASNGFSFTVTSSAPTPTISNIQPNPAAVGTSVTITGTNFGASRGTSAVTFNGTAATPTSWGASSIVVPVPTGATSGPVVVTVGGTASNGFSFTVNAALPGDAITWHYDNMRTGLNPNETTLTTTNVNSTTFGKVGEFAVSGQIDGEILYAGQINIPGVGTKNVIYFGTENDMVYAVDADSIGGSSATVLWSKSLVPSGELAAAPEGGCGNINPNGITATPVIDRGRNAIYVVAMTMNSTTNTTQYDRLHALDLGTGNELFSGPTTILATFPGTGGNIQNGVVTFDAKLHHERAALLDVGGNIFTTWSGQAGDCGAYSGWVIAYSADTLARAGVLDVSPAATGAGIWNGGGGPAADSAGSVYVTTGNAFGFNPSSPGNNYPNSVLRLTPPSGTITVGDFWTPFDTGMLDNEDADLGSASILILPDVVDNSSVTHHLAVAAGKDGNMYVVNRDNLGQFNSLQNNIVQTILLSGNENFSTPVYFNNTVYVCPSSNPVKAFPISNALLATAPSTQSAHSFGGTGAVISASSNGITNGIIWALDYSPGVLYAYDATNLTHLLYASSQAASNRDVTAAIAGHFISPVVANGKVYIGTGSTVAVFGLLP